MKLAELEAKGGVVAGEPIRKAVEWVHKLADGTEMTEKFDIFVQRKSAETMNRIRRTATDEMDRNALLISSFVRLGDDGEDEIPYATALKLDDDLQIVLLKAVNDAFEARADPKN